MKISHRSNSNEVFPGRKKEQKCFYTNSPQEQKDTKRSHEYCYTHILPQECSNKGLQKVERLIFEKDAGLRIATNLSRAHLKRHSVPKNKKCNQRLKINSNRQFWRSGRTGCCLVQAGGAETKKLEGVWALAGGS